MEAGKWQAGADGALSRKSRHKRAGARRGG